MKGKNKIGYIDLLDRSDNPSGTVTDAVAWAQKDYRWWTRLFRCACCRFLQSDTRQKLQIHHRKH